mgnify:CR=1 FL=1
MYITLTGKDRDALLKSAAKRVVFEGGHDWSGKGSNRVLHWPVCSRCNLVALKNEATRKSKCYRWVDG